MVRLAPCRGGHAAVLLTAVLVLAAASSVRAGGPLVICDPATGRAFGFAPGQVPVFTDRGPLGILDNAQATALGIQAASEWASVPTSSFDAAFGGDIGADIDATNLLTVVGVLQGHGGVDMIFDSDGGIIEGLFGAPPGVAGIAGPEFLDPSTCAITEAWEIINGKLIDPGDVGGAAYGGVLTHELGHAIGLAHTQTNGGVYYFGDDPVPVGCPAPFAVPVSAADVETMYPFIDIRPGEAGVEMATVDVRDDLAALSNVYPGPGWPGSFPALSGVVYDTDAITPLRGINVIARNLADPFAGAVSMLSGASTNGVLGPDGSFLLAGLDPGADYVVYLDRIIAGGFSTGLSELWEEEYWNGGSESNDATLDLACDFVTVQPTGVVDPILNEPADPGEPNDTPATAEPIGCASTIDRVVYPLGDLDFFRFDLAVAATVRIDVDAAEAGSTLDSVLGLFDATTQTRLRFSDDDPGPGERVTLDSFIGQMLDPGSYFIGLSSFDDTNFDGTGAITQGSYSLRLDCFPSPPPPAPGDLLGATGNFVTLLDVERTTGTGTFRAVEGAFGPVVGLTMSPDGVLYGSTGLGNLILIDPIDGRETLVGYHGTGVLNGLELVGDVLYGTIFAGADTTLVQIDPTTAALTTVGATGLHLITGLAWDAQRGRLLGVTGGGPSDLVVLDPTSGAATVIGATGFERLGSLVFGPDGVLYAGVGPGASTEAGSLVTLDPYTGRGSLVGPSGWGGLTGLALLPTATPVLAVPTLTPLALLLLVLALAVAGMIVIRL